MPRGLAHIYDSGTRVPLVIAGVTVKFPGRVTDGFVSFEDFLPTFVDLAEAERPELVDGVSLVPMLTNPVANGRSSVFLERERHANVRRGDLCYPVRAVRNEEFFYIRNVKPDRGPSGDAEFYYSVGEYGDVDASLTKQLLLKEPRPPEWDGYFQKVFGLRPAEELYNVRTDTDQVHNLAADPAYAATLARLRLQVDDWMRSTGDPRVDPNDDSFDRYKYHGKSRRQPAAVRPE